MASSNTCTRLPTKQNMFVIWDLPGKGPCGEDGKLVCRRCHRITFFKELSRNSLEILVRPMGQQAVWRCLFRFFRIRLKIAFFHDVRKPYDSKVF